MDERAMTLPQAMAIELVVKLPLAVSVGRVAKLPGDQERRSTTTSDMHTRVERLLSC